MSLCRERFCGILVRIEVQYIRRFVSINVDGETQRVSVTLLINLLLTVLVARGNSICEMFTLESTNQF